MDLLLWEVEFGAEWFWFSSWVLLDPVLGEVGSGVG